MIRTFLSVSRIFRATVIPSACPISISRKITSKLFILLLPLDRCSPFPEHFCFYRIKVSLFAMRHNISSIFPVVAISSSQIATFIISTPRFLFFLQFFQQSAWIDHTISCHTHPFFCTLLSGHNTHPMFHSS